MTEDFDTIDEGTISETPATETPAEAQPSWMTDNSTQTYDAALDPTKRIRFLTTNGTYDTAVEDGQPMTLAAALTLTGLRYNNASVFELDGARITLDTMLQPGSQVVAINSVKGG